MRRARTTRTEGLARPRGFALEPSASAEERTTRRGSDRTRFPPHQRRPAGVGRACGGRARNRATQTCASGVPRSLRASTRHHDWSRRAGVGRERTISGFDGARQNGGGAEDRRGRRAGAHLHSTPRAKNKRLENRASRDVSVRDLLSARPQHGARGTPSARAYRRRGTRRPDRRPGRCEGAESSLGWTSQRGIVGADLKIARAPRHHGVLGGSSGRHAGSAASSLSASSRRRTSRNSARSRSRRGCCR